MNLLRCLDVFSTTRQCIRTQALASKSVVVQLYVLDDVHSSSSLAFHSSSAIASRNDIYQRCACSIMVVMSKQHQQTHVNALCSKFWQKCWLWSDIFPHATKSTPPTLIVLPNHHITSNHKKKTNILLMHRPGIEPGASRNCPVEDGNG